MRTIASRLSTAVLSLALVSLGSACEGEDAGEDAAPADTMATAGPTADEPVSTGIEPGVSSTSETLVTNSMPHAMVVTVEYEGGGATELGIVPAGGEQAFTLAASSGETVTLVASDEADTHSRNTTLALAEGETESWTIE